MAERELPIDAGVELDRLRQWIGRRVERTELIAAAPVGLLSATLDRDDPPPQDGDPLPPLWHWLYHHPRVRASAIGPDGHPTLGDFLPPIPLPRRMWAGSRFEFLRPLRIGQTVTKVSSIADVQAKSGRSGALVFVLVRHELHGPEGLAVREEQDLVYRAAAEAGGSKPAHGASAAASGAADFARDVLPDEVLLFRYSALTFNGHRIHYDHRYVTEIEGYPGLVVHGPLLATLLMDLLRRVRPTADVATFRFRAVSPLFVGSRFRVAGRSAEEAVSLWVEGPEARLAMEASATLR